MIKNNLYHIFRRLIKNKVSTFLVLIGLTIGISTCLIIYLKVDYDLSFDNFHSNTDKIFRIVRITSGLDYLNGEPEYNTGVYYGMPYEIEKAEPYIENLCKVYYIDNADFIINSDGINENKKFSEQEGVVFIDPEFFKIFDFYDKNYWIYGNPEESLDEPFSIVLDHETANKYFGDMNPIGKTILGFDDNILTVKGVINNFPPNTEFPFKVFISYSSFEKFIPDLKTNWNRLGGNICFLKLKNPTDVAKVEHTLKTILTEHTSEENAASESFKLQSFKSIHFDKRFGNFNNRTVPYELILALSLIGFLIIVISSLNYSVLSLAQSLKNRKEVAVRKTFGSNQIQIIFQSFSEPFILTLIAIISGVVLSKIIMLKFNYFFDFPFQNFHILEPSILIFLIILLIVITLISGSYSAFWNSKANPINSLKENLYFSTKNKFSLNNSVVVFQFAAGIVVLVSTLFMIKQIYYMNNADLGYNKNGIVLLKLPNEERDRINNFRQEILKNPMLEEMAIHSNCPAKSRRWTDISRFTNNVETRIVTEIKFIDTNYIKNYQLELICGDILNQTGNARQIIVNQELLHELDYNNYCDALDKELKLYGSEPCRVVGIVKDFHAGSFHDFIRPCVMILDNKNNHGNAGIRLSNAAFETKSNFNKAIKIIEKQYKETFGTGDFSYELLDEWIASRYREEQKLEKLFIVFTIITFLISCIGIFSMSYFTIEQQSKEIAIRKINGAAFSKILGLINKRYFIILCIAMLLSWPLAWYAMQKWLENFAYKTELSWWIFAIAGVLALGIALLTVSWQSWRAATRNPVEALRYE